MGRFKGSDYDRFWSKVSLTANDNLCWGWNATKHKKGYGNYWFNSELRRATHVSWFYKHGVLPDKGTFMCHTCDNPNCVNPNHLFIGDNNANIQDKVNKGRCSCLRGNDNPKAKVTENDVIKIRKLFKDGATRKEIHSMFCIAPVTINQIIRRHIWKHI